MDIGTTAAAAALAGFASEISGYSFAELDAGNVPGGLQTTVFIAQQEQILMNEYHGLATYDADASSATVPATAFGLQNITLGDFMKSVMSDLPSLEKALPAVFGAGSASAMLSTFASDFPDLAEEATALMHASSFTAALSELATVDPTIYNQVTNASGAMAVLEALGRNHAGVAVSHHSV